MILHNDRDAFRALLDDVHQKTGYRTDVLEKDYYVVLFLKELANLQRNGLPAYFKGGTALYKALKSTNRFSEDIDLSVDVRGCSRTQSEKRLESATKRFTSLNRNSQLGYTHRSEIVSIYEYNPIMSFDKNDELQRFGKLKIEATSFTICEPTEQMEVSPLLYEYALPQQRKVLKEQYEVYPFFVDTISLERIFIDKLFAAEAYVRRSEEGNKSFEAAKHIYDLAILKSQEKIKAFMCDPTQMKNLLDIRLNEEKERHDGIPYVSPNQFRVFDEAEYNESVKKAYSIMQNQYVLNDKDRISFEDAIDSLKCIGNILFENIAWINSYIPKSRDDRGDR